jgi:hypothetical protein
MIQLTNYTLSIFVGILLSDAWLIRIKPHWNPKIGFCQSFKHFDYFWTVFQALAHYCPSYPWLVLKKAKGLIYPALQFETPPGGPEGPRGPPGEGIVLFQ